jgi:hypothetical protein
VERAAPVLEENKRLLASVEAHEKMLADAHNDKARVEARVTQL